MISYRHPLPAPEVGLVIPRVQKTSLAPFLRVAIQHPEPLRLVCMDPTPEDRGSRIAIKEKLRLYNMLTLV